MTWNAADGTIYPLFDVTHCERHVKQHGTNCRDQSRQTNIQKQPWKLRDIEKLDKGLHLTNPGQPGSDAGTRAEVQPKFEALTQSHPEG